MRSQHTWGPAHCSAPCQPRSNRAYSTHLLLPGWERVDWQWHGVAGGQNTGAPFTPSLSQPAMGLGVILYHLHSGSRSQQPSPGCGESPGSQRRGAAARVPLVEVGWKLALEVERALRLLVWQWWPQSFDHKLVFATRVRTIEAKLLEISNQIFAFHWTQARHYTASLILKVIPSTTGSERCLETRSNIHSSSTSSNSSRQASRVAVWA